MFAVGYEGYKTSPIIFAMLRDFLGEGLEALLALNLPVANLLDFHPMVGEGYNLIRSVRFLTLLGVRHGRAGAISSMAVKGVEVMPQRASEQLLETDQPRSSQACLRFPTPTACHDATPTACHPLPPRSWPMWRWFWCRCSSAPSTT